MNDPAPFDPPKTSPLLIVISGPSGVGKDSVIRRMKERHLPVYFVVTATTRPPRDDEVEGIDYFFLTQDQFASMIENDELLEYAYVYNDYKGIPRSQVSKALASGDDVIMRLDVQGSASIRKLCPEAVLIFLTVQDEEELVQRLTRRESETPDELNMRIAVARQEFRRIHEFDYVLVNRQDHLDETVDGILTIIRAEHSRVNPRKVSL